MTPLSHVATLALRCADMTDALYGREPAKHGVLIRSKHARDDLALIQVSPGGAVHLCLAGTRTENAEGMRSLKQWLGSGGNFARWGKMHRNNDGSGTHAGAHRAFSDIESDLRDVLLTLNCRRDTPGHAPICVYGHSRGHMLAMEFVRRHGAEFRIADVLTLGGPRVHDRRGGEIVMGYCSRIFRLTNNNDPVPHLPTPLRGYAHYGERYHFDRRGRIHSNGLGWLASAGDGLAGRVESLGRLSLLDGVADHKMSGYGPAIRAWGASLKPNA